MKKLITLACLAVVLIAVSLSCLATKARENVTLPVARTLWVSVRADVALGIDSSLADTAPAKAAVEELQTALDQGNVVQLAMSPWPLLEPYAQHGVDVRVSLGELSQLSAESYRERHRQFGRVLAKFQVIQ